MEAIRRQRELLLLWHHTLHSLQVCSAAAALRVTHVFSEATLLSLSLLQSLRDAAECADDDTVSAQVAPAVHLSPPLMSLPRIRLSLICCIRLLRQRALICGACSLARGLRSRRNDLRAPAHYAL
jgi:hypothetical protein